MFTEGNTKIHLLGFVRIFLVLLQILLRSQIRPPKTCFFMLSSKNTLAYKSDQVINYGNEAIRMGFRDAGYQLYRIAHLDRFANRNN